MTIYKLTDLNGNPKSLHKPNLAINGDFQIWQRGEEFTNVANGTRIADMWRVYNLTSPNLSIKKVADGMQVTNVAGYVSIYQTVPEDIYTSSDVFTIVKSVDGVVTVQEATFSESSHQINFGISSNCIINWICLFAGDIAYDHVKEDKAIAQMRCEKYVLKLPTSYSGYTGSTSYIYFVSEKLMGMASTPSVDVIPTTIRCVFEGGVTAYNISNITVNKASGEINVQVNSPPSSLASKCIGGWFDKNIILSCEP